jgi:hypothetical protein
VEMEHSNFQLQQTIWTINHMTIWKLNSITIRFHLWTFQLQNLIT